MKSWMFLLLPLYLGAADLAHLVELTTTNETVQQARLGAKAARKSLEGVERGYLPSVTLDGYSQWLQDKGPLEPGRSSTLSATASYVVYDGGKKQDLVKEMEATVEGAKYREAYAKNSVALETVRAYFQGLSVEAAIAAKEQEAKQLEAETARLERFLAVGSASPDQVERLKAGLAQARYELASLEHQRHQLLSALEIMAGCPVAKLVPATLALPEKLDPRERPELSAAMKDAEALGHKAVASSSAYRPTLVLQDTYTFYDYGDDDMSFPIDLIDKQNKVAVAVSITLLDFSAHGRQYEAGMIQKRAKELESAYLARQADAEVRLARLALETAQTQTVAAQQRVAAAGKTYDLVAKKFRAGLADNVDYLDALSGKSDADSSLAASRYNEEIKKAELLYAAGHSIKEYLK